MDEEMREHLGIKMKGPGGYEIVTISVGTGNGWEFSEDVLKASLALWDGWSVLLTITLIRGPSGILPG